MESTSLLLILSFQLRSPGRMGSFLLTPGSRGRCWGECRGRTGAVRKSGGEGVQAQPLGRDGQDWQVTEQKEKHKIRLTSLFLLFLPFFFFFFYKEGLSCDIWVQVCGA